MMNKKIRIALLDLNNNHPNQGFKNIEDLTKAFKENSEEEISIQIFDVRYRCEIPNVDDFDIFISSGGPGTPLREGYIWEEKYSEFLDGIWQHNLEKEEKKYLFLICHSFQLAVLHWDLAHVCPRKSDSFGVMPVHKTLEGKDEFLFQNLPDPFYAIDSRSFQCIEPDDEKLELFDMKIVAMEKIRPHVKLERAIMAIRFSDEIFGTQFHPEAEPIGFMENLKVETNKQTMIRHHGLDKYQETLDRIDDPDKIILTQAQIIPRFLKDAKEKILKNRMEMA